MGKLIVLFVLTLFLNVFLTGCICKELDRFFPDDSNNGGNGDTGQDNDNGEDAVDNISNSNISDPQNNTGTPPPAQDYYNVSDYVYNPDAALNIYFLNVGYASAILLEKGDFHMLIDAGDPSGGNVIVNKMQELNFDDVEVMVITHPTQKRLSGAARVIDSFKINEVWNNGVVTDEYEPIKQKIEQNNIPVRSVIAGNKFTYNGLEIEIYNPINDTFTPDNENINSIIMRIKDHNFAVLFTSDLENLELNNIRSSHPNIYADIVEVPRNGKSSIRTLASTNQMIIRLIDTTKPEAMIISVGPNNDKAPSPQLITAVQTQGVPIYRTDNDGTILISYMNGQYNIYTNK
jgi:competence protein ComEC